MKETVIINSQNIKIFCKTYKMSYRELADEIGMTEASIKTAVSIGKISNQTQASIRMLIKIKEQEKRLNEFKEAVSAIRTIGL